VKRVSVRAGPTQGSAGGSGTGRLLLVTFLDGLVKSRNLQLLPPYIVEYKKSKYASGCGQPNSTRLFTVLSFLVRTRKVTMGIKTERGQLCQYFEIKAWRPEEQGVHRYAAVTKPAG
jgi:hypothetical protein